MRVVIDAVFRHGYISAEFVPIFTCDAVHYVGSNLAMGAGVVVEYY